MRSPIPSSVRVFVRGGALLARLAPPRLRADLEADGLLVLEDICARAHRRGGLGALFRTGLAEWFNLIATVWRARRTAKTPHRVSGGGRGGFRRDLVQAARSLRTGRGTTALAVLTLALGIGVNTAVFSTLDSLLFRPVPYADADRLVGLWSYYAPGKFMLRGQFSPALVAEWRKQTDLFDRVEGAEEKSLIFDNGRGAEMITGSVVTSGLFSMLGVAPRMGRIFHEGDGRGGTSAIAIVSERFWHSQLAHDPGVVGRTIQLDAERFEIVGVMPQTFRYPGESHDIWLPIDAASPPPGSHHTNLAAIARTREGLPRAEAELRVTARGEEVNRASGGAGDAGARVVTLGELFDDRTARSLWVLGGAVVVLLLIVCANVANLTLARSMARTRDLAVRAALGASRGALFRVALLEHAIIGLIGAAIGLAIAAAAIAVVVAALPEAMTSSSLNVIDLDWRTLGFLATCAMMTILAFGLPPAIVASRSSVVSTLGRESRSATGSPAARRFRAGLVVLEVALSIVLLVGAALMTRSLLKLQAVDIGLDPQGLLALRVGFPERGFEDARGIDLVTEDIIARLAATPGVQHASAGSVPPNESMISLGALEFGDRPGERTKNKKLLTRVYETWPGYFAAAGIRLIEGREPVERDVEGAAVVSRDFAAKHWPGRSPVGARFRIGEHPWRTVVGVAAELRRLGETADGAQEEVYYPHDQVSGVMHAAGRASAVKLYRTFIVRTGEPGELARRLGDVVHEADSRVILTSTTLVAHQFADLIARPRIVFLMMAIFAGVGLLLAAAGLYAVLAHLVSQRLREIGVRLAIGASPSDIARLVLRSGATLAGIGLVIGVAGAVALTGVMRTLLYEVEPSDPLAVIVAIALLGITALAATLVPARRAMRVDPVQLLRES